MIVAYKSGLVEKYTELGKRVWATRVTTQAVQLHSALLVARILWLGCSDGSLRLVDAGSGRPHSQWRAHTLPVKSLAVMGTTVYSLAKDGSIRGWPAVQPPPPAAAQAWKEGARMSLRHHQLRVVAGTWNVNSTRPSPRSLYDWLGCHADEGVDLVCVGLQEVEIGTSSVATDAVRNIINRAALEKGNANAQWWSEQLLSALGGPEMFTRVALRQMSGILMITFCRNALVPHVGEVATSSVACGLLGVAGNKGAAAISLSLYRRRLIFLSSHFAAHLEKLEERNADYTKIMRCLRFENTSASASTNPKAIAVGHAGILSAEDEPVAVECAEVPQPGFNSSAESMCPGMGDAEAVVWMGDFNYRLSATYEWTVSRAEAGAFAELLTVDQLRTEMGRGAIFHSLCEGPLLFAPTYKFDKGVPASELRPLPYDSSDKKRVPAWTDRILWRGTLPPPPGSAASSSREEDVSVSLFTDGLDAVTTPTTGNGGLSRSSSSSSALANMWGGAGSSALSGLAYGAAMGVCDSDHKPVWCKLQLQLPAHVQQQKRRMSEQVLNDIRKELCPRAAPRLTLHIESTQPIMSHQVPDDVPTLVLKRDEVEEVLIQNPGPAPVLMSAIGDGRRLPLWLEVQPTSCLVPPRGSVRFTLQAAAPDGACQGLGGGAAALRAQEVILRVWGQHLTSLGRGSGQPSHPLHYRSQSETMQPLLLRVQSLYY
ncbi:Endonuclease/exonuclease/phosphatase [Dunaliella salina]|nr:Endonuclease/exonuclease/phosphatase [Dunaliella salina]|eukprot:KAF5835728.1 Endonuclease/exonuclease/phosphatase [Dunaliella salina]